MTESSPKRWEHDLITFLNHSRVRQSIWKLNSKGNVGPSRKVLRFKTKRDRFRT